MAPSQRKPKKKPAAGGGRAADAPPSAPSQAVLLARGAAGRVTDAFAVGGVVSQLAESVWYVLYWALLPSLLAPLLLKLPLEQCPSALVTAAVSFLLVRGHAAFGSWGNDYQPEASVLRYMRGELSTGGAVQSIGVCLLGGLAAGQMLKFLPVELLELPFWLAAEQGFILAVGVEFCCAVPPFCAYAAAAVLTSDVERRSPPPAAVADDDDDGRSEDGQTIAAAPQPPKHPVAVRGVEELLAAAVAGSVALAEGLTAGGPCLNGAFAVADGYVRGEWTFAAAILAADLAAAAVAGWFVKMRDPPAELPAAATPGAGKAAGKSKRRNELFVAAKKRD